MKECVRCGYCCTIGPCSFGEWNPDKGQCKFLTSESLCSKYGEILLMPGSDVDPAFGKGCSSPLFNVRREAKIRERQRAPIGEAPTPKGAKTPNGGDFHSGKIAPKGAEI